jgi:metal-sulfur cluster biosynthetic enzyme
MTEENAKNQPSWQAQLSNPELMDDFIKSMKEIVDPEIGLDIIQLGLVRDLVIENDKAILTMILTTPFCPYGPSLVESTRLKAEESLKRPVTIVFGDEQWDFSLMEEGLRDDWGIY